MAKLGKKERELLEKMGITLKPSDFETPIEKTEPAKEMAKWEAQSLLISLTWPYPDLVSVECRNPTCKKKFLTNYKANVYCSMECHKIELERKGLVWRPERSFYEQWGNLEPPLMIPPEAIRAMRRLLSIVDQGSPQVSHSPEPGFVVAENNPIDYDAALHAPLVPYNDPDTPKEQPVDNSEEDFLKLLSSLDD